MEPEGSLPHSQQPATSLSWTTLIHSTSFHPVSFKIHFNTVLPSIPRSPKCSVSLRFPPLPNPNTNRSVPHYPVSSILLSLPLRARYLAQYPILEHPLIANRRQTILNRMVTGIPPVQYALRFFMNVILACWSCSQIYELATLTRDSYQRWFIHVFCYGLILS